jgi:hypothetical protein
MTVTARAVEMVTFTIVLDLTRETEKAYKVMHGGYLPKSLVTAERTGDIVAQWETSQKKKLIECVIANVTMPKWLAKR